MQLLVGWSTQDITPQGPVELIGQYYQRTSRRVRDPLTVTAVAFEQKVGSSLQQSVMVSIDTVFVTREFQEKVQAQLKSRLPDLNPLLVTLNATHTHSGASWFAPFRWWVAAKDTVPSSEILNLMLKGVVNAVAAAWASRKPAGTSSASAFATVGFCRRALYSGGFAEMYGDPKRTDFVGIEAGSDDAVRMLFTWDAESQLTGVIVNVACPAQVLEASYVISADFFGQLRDEIKAKYGTGVHLLAQLSAAGDQSPRNLPAESTESINYWNEDGLVAIGRRLARAVDEGYGTARAGIQFFTRLMHTVNELVLPLRRVSAAQYEQARAEISELTKGYSDMAAASRARYDDFIADVATREIQQIRGPFDDKGLDFVRIENAQAVVTRFEVQDRTPSFQMELHAMRLGDCAFVFNPFELYLDYGQMIQARSRAGTTFVVQLAGDAAGYLPTARAAETGGYGALIINGQVGPEGGRALVEASVEAIGRLWD